MPGPCLRLHAPPVAVAAFEPLCEPRERGFKDGFGEGSACVRACGCAVRPVFGPGPTSLRSEMRTLACSMPPFGKRVLEAVWKPGFFHTRGAALSRPARLLEAATPWLLVEALPPPAERFHTGPTTASGTDRKVRRMQADTDTQNAAKDAICVLRNHAHALGHFGTHDMSYAAHRHKQTHHKHNYACAHGQSQRISSSSAAHQAICLRSIGLMALACPCSSHAFTQAHTHQYIYAPESMHAQSHSHAHDIYTDTNSGMKHGMCTDVHSQRYTHIYAKAPQRCHYTERGSQAHPRRQERARVGIMCTPVAHRHAFFISFHLYPPTHTDIRMQA